ncbi:immunity protein Imm2 [Pseudomonas sp. PDM05]|nr:immunity protein Imm2 [Pseudomonas sp. PDM05]
MMEERVTYAEIRAWFLGSYYSYCRVKLRHRSAWVEGESEVGFAYSELENSFDLPVEKLMLEILALVLSAGRSSESVKKYHMDAALKLIEQIDLSSMLKELPPEEAADLVEDLRLLGIC